MTSLDISNNNLGELVLPEGWTKKSKDNDGMAPWVYEHTNGTKQENHPGKPEGVIAIADAIPTMGALASLDLSENKIPAEQMDPIKTLCESKQIALKK